MSAAPWSIPLLSSHTFRDGEINSDVVLAGLVGDGNERSDGKITLESEAGYDEHGSAAR